VDGFDVVERILASTSGGASIIIEGGRLVEALHIGPEALPTATRSVLGDAGAAHAFIYS
jgi:hypothetical protein